MNLFSQYQFSLKKDSQQISQDKKISLKINCIFFIVLDEWEKKKNLCQKQEKEKSLLTKIRIYFSIFSFDTMRTFFKRKNFHKKSFLKFLKTYKENLVWKISLFESIIQKSTFQNKKILIFTKNLSWVSLLTFPKSNPPQSLSFLKTTLPQAPSPKPPSKSIFHSSESLRNFLIQCSIRLQRLNIRVTAIYLSH